MVTMTSFIDSADDPANPGVIEPRDVSMGARPADDERCEEEETSKKTRTTFTLPTLVELPDTLSDERADGICTDMWRNDGKPKSGRPGRKYKPAQSQPFANGHHHHQHQIGGSVGNKAASSPLASSPLSSPRDWQSSLREGSNGHTTPWNCSLASPKPSSSPRSPRPPRRLPSLSRSDSQESATTSPRENDILKADGVSSGHDNMNASELKEDAQDYHEECPLDGRFHHIPLPTSSLLFQQIMTDFHERPSASLDTRSPGDLMVRRSSLARTTLGSPPLLPVDEVPDELSRMSELGLDIELAPPPGTGSNYEKMNTEEATSDFGGNVDHHNQSTDIDKKHHPQAMLKINEDNESKNHKKKTSPRRHVKFPAESKYPTCPITDDDSTEKPGIIISVPTEDSLQPTALQGQRGGQRKTRPKLRSRDAETSVSGESCTTGSSEMSASSPERSPKPRRNTSDQSLRHRPITPARSHHESEGTINMKTAGQIIRFITAAAASSTAPGLNRKQKLLPSEIRLPVVDPSQRLLRRNRDETMRLVKQAVDLKVEGEEKSDVYSWDELRDCRYLRTKKNPKDSRRNSLLGFNEI